MADQADTKTFVGQSIERVEDSILLTGRARFSDHQPTVTGTLHAAMLRSPHAHAEIVSIDKSKALALPGVSAILTGEDLTEMASAFLIVIKQPMQHYSLAVGKVRYVGEPVAVVVASDRYIAEDALDLIAVEYRVMDAVVDPIAATDSGAPVLYEEVGDNVVSTREFSYGEPDKAFAEADKIVSLTAPYPRNSQTPMEGFVVNADYSPDTDSYDVASNYQGPFTSHPVMALALGVPSSRLRMRVPAFSGGGFGVKVQIFPYVVLMCLCSKAAGHPVKWVEDRLEHLSAAAAAPNRVTEIEAAVKSDGTVTAFRFDQLDDYGAYLRAPMPGPLYRMHGTLTGAYHIKNLAVKNRVVMTNKCPSGMIRGFGGPQMYFAIERLMHRVAVELDLDPLDVIKKNLVPAGSFPYRAAAGALFDSGDYQTAVERAVNEGGLAEIKQRRDKARADGKIYGIGYSVVVEPAQSNMGYLSNILPAEERRKNPKGGAVSNATVNVDPLGTVSVTADSLPQGQGHATVLSQIVADELGLTPADVSVNMELDTQKDAWSIATGNYSARFSSSTTVAAHKAAVKVRDKVARIASATLNVPADQLEFADGKIFAADNPENSLKFYRVAGSAHWTPGSLPDGMDPGIRETGTWSPPQLEPPNDEDQINTSLTYGFVFDYCGVEIDPDTGQVHVDKYITMHDSGTLLNPMLADGQVYGAFSWAIGCALFEEFAYGDDGSFLSGTFADYLCPTAPEVPEPLILHMETPTTFTPLGAKGIGEGNVMSTPACLANAVCDALDVKTVSLPMSPSKISALIQTEERAPPAGSTRQADAAPTEGGRVIKGSGETTVPASPDEVWQTLLDPDKLAAVIPGCHSLDKVGDNSYHAEVSLGVGVVRGRFQASVDMSEMDPPNSVRLSGGVQGPLGASKGSGNVKLAAVEGGTHVTYDYTVVISGKVAAVGGRMLEGAARIVIGQFFERLVSQVGGGKTSTTTGTSPAGETLWQRILRAFGIGR